MIDPQIKGNEFHMDYSTLINLGRMFKQKRGLGITGVQGSIYVTLKFLNIKDQMSADF